VNLLLNLSRYATMPLDSAFLKDMLRDYRRPLDKVGEWVRQGYLVQLRRGLYAVGPELSHIKPEPFLVANHLYGPSYVSMESALSFWGFIPEQVVETVSMTAAKPHTFHTPLGRFSYHHLPSPYASLGTTTVELLEQRNAMVATPDKALCDLVVTTAGLRLRSIRAAQAYLIEDLRIDEAELKTLDIPRIQSWIPWAPKAQSLQVMVSALQRL
jgi:predicted transcriptional regulator of viral defense system